MIAQLLQTHGWVLDTHTAIASKTYATAVGPKQALAYYTQWPQSDCVVLSGEYVSEGRNVLAICSELIPHDADPEMVRQLVHRFATRCDVAVGDSYAARLLKEPA